MLKIILDIKKANTIEETSIKTKICQDEKKNYYCVINNEKIKLICKQIKDRYIVNTEILVKQIDVNTDKRSQDLYAKIVINFE